MSKDARILRPSWLVSATGTALAELAEASAKIGYCSEDTISTKTGQKESAAHCRLSNTLEGINKLKEQGNTLEQIE